MLDQANRRLPQATVRRLPQALVIGCIVGAGALPAWAGEPGGHGDPVAPLVLGLAVILVAAKLGGDLAVRAGQPTVLGELIIGVVLGNLTLVGLPALDGVANDATIDMLARLGVLILLFEVGLESTVAQMLQVGVSSFVVACLGVAAPFTLGWLVGIWLLPAAGGYAHAFLGATLCATSVGISARVLKDLNRSQSPEARVILGAAVIDDVLGLVILAVVSGAIVAADSGGVLSLSAAAMLVTKAVLFLVGSLVLGVYLSPKLFSLASRLRAREVLLATGLAFCFALSWLANAIGLAPIVGAFAAGLILEEVHYRDFVGRGEHPLGELVRPISSFLVPVFFVLMGMHTNLRSFAQPGVLGLAAVLIVAACVGKQLCSLGALGKGIDRLTVGIGMIPRGEVGLIFANVGLSLTLQGRPVIDTGVFSAVVVMVIVTTMMTPPLLKWSLGRAEHARAQA